MEKNESRMSLTRALVQLKLLDKRINKSLLDSFITYKVGDDVKDLKSTPEASLQSVKDLIERRDLIKAKIMHANTVTEVTIAGVDMSIAAAIDRKKSIVYMQKLLKSMVSQLAKATRSVEENNTEMKYRLDNMLQANFGKDLKAREEELEAIVAPFEKRYKSELVDPIELVTKIEELTKYIDDFESEVDLTLSEANAVTIIEV